MIYTFKTLKNLSFDEYKNEFHFNKFLRYNYIKYLLYEDTEFI